MNKETLIKNLKEINLKLVTEDGADDAMYDILDLLNDYQQETKDDFWHSLWDNLFTAEQVKDEVIKKLQSSKDVTPDLLHNIASQLYSYNYNTVWIQRIGNQYFSICKQTVKNLIISLLKKLEPQTYEEYRKQIIEKLKGIAIDFNDLDNTFEQIAGICTEYKLDTNDDRLEDFCNNRFLSTEEVRDELQDLFEFNTSLPDDLHEIKRRLKLCALESLYYEKLADNSYIDLNYNSLYELKEDLLRMLEDKDND